MKYLPKTELEAILAAAAKESVRDHLLLMMSFNHGLRVSEAVKKLTVDNIQDGYLVMERSKRSKSIVHPLLPAEREILKTYMAGKTGRLFPISRVQAWRLVQYYGEKAGVPKHLCHPHALRHSCGKLGFDGGMTIPEVQAYLGHKNGANTLIYMQTTERDAANAFAKATGGKHDR